MLQGLIQEEGWHFQGLKDYRNIFMELTMDLTEAGNL